MEELLVIAFYLAEFPHLLVEVEEVAVGIVEGHGDEVGIEHLLVFIGNVLNVAYLVDFLGNILDGINDEARFAMFVLDDGVAVEFAPQGLVECSLIEVEVHVEMVNDA